MVVRAKAMPQPAPPKTFRRCGPAGFPIARVRLTSPDGSASTIFQVLAAAMSDGGVSGVSIESDGILGDIRQRSSCSGGCVSREAAASLGDEVLMINPWIPTL